MFLSYCKKNSETIQGDQESKVRIYLQEYTQRKSELTGEEKLSSVCVCVCVCVCVFWLLLLLLSSVCLFFDKPIMRGV